MRAGNDAVSQRNPVEQQPAPRKTATRSRPTALAGPRGACCPATLPLPVSPPCSVLLSVGSLVAGRGCFVFQFVLHRPPPLWLRAFVAGERRLFAGALRRQLLEPVRLRGRLALAQLSQRPLQISQRKRHHRGDGQTNKKKQRDVSASPLSRQKDYFVFSPQPAARSKLRPWGTVLVVGDRQEFRHGHAHRSTLGVALSSCEAMAHLTDGRGGLPLFDILPLFV